MWAAVAWGAQVSVHLSAPGWPPTNPPRPVEILIVGGPSSEKAQKEILVSAALPGTLKVDLPEPGVWYVKGRAAGFWSETSVIVTPDLKESVDLRLWPVATLRAEITGKGRHPTNVSVRFQPVVEPMEEPKPDAFPSGANECVLDGRFLECAIPAGLADYSLRSSGYVPIYRWNQTNAPGEVVKLGKLEFRRGSALIGRVTFPPGKRVEKGSSVRVTLEPDAARAMRPEEARRSSIAANTATPNARGLFVFEGVKPGGYQISATASGLISERRAVTIIDGLEAELREPLALVLPMTLDVTIEPSIDPWRKPWIIELSRIDLEKRHGVDLGHSPASDGGRWVRRGLPPGDYLLKVRRQPQGVWYSARVEIKEDTNLQVKVPLTRVDGALKLGGVPLPGSIWFGGELGEISVPVTTDEQGTFRAILPTVENNIWKDVDVVADRPQVRRSLSDVRLRGPDDKGIFRLEIDLAANRVYGEVTTDNGVPVSSRATVYASIAGTRGEFLQIDVDEAGQFSFNGLAAATYSVRALGPDGKSDAVSVAVEEDSQEYVTLVLKKGAHLEGVVTSDYGAVAGAQVKVYPDDRTGFDVVEWALTDPEGHFMVAVPAAAAQVSVTVSAPGFAYRFFAVDLNPGQVLPIRLDQNAGRLEILVEEQQESQLQPIVFHGGAFLAIQNLLNAGGQWDGPTFSMENLESGQYEVCMTTPFEAPAFARSTRPKERCASGFLPPGGRLSLNLPSAARTNTEN
jgi:hypothetical protein